MTRTAFSPAAAHLLSRAAFGPTPAEVERLSALRLPQAVHALIVDATWAPQPNRPAWVREPWVNTQRGWADTSKEDLANNHGRTTARYAEEMIDLRAWWLGEMIRTSGPLRETLTLFWHGHFTSGFEKVRISQALYQQNVLQRRHALGNFRKLLGAMLKDAAMMLYLDMEDSDAEHLNENLARELCELFTLGVGQYTESDVRETARALTGWTLDVPRGVVKADRPESENLNRAFRRDGLHAQFIAERHDAGSKTILGCTGHWGLEDVADILAAQPATARFVSGKLIEYFGAADPKGALRQRMADIFMANARSSTQMAEVARALLTAPEFYADESRANHIKSPVQLLVGAVRQLQVTVEATPNLAQYVDAMGQRLFEPPNVRGWPGGRTWLNAGTMATRLHLGEVLLDGVVLDGLEPLAPARGFTRSRESRQADAAMGVEMSREAQFKAKRDAAGIRTRFEPQALFPAGAPPQPAELVDALTQRLLIRPLQADVRRTLITAAQTLPETQRVRELTRLILAAPEYQVA